MKKQSVTGLVMMAALLGVLATGCTTWTAHKGISVTEPEFLTPKLKKQNLLSNPSFEDSSSLAWTLVSFISNNNAGRIMPFDKARDGKKVAYFDTGTDHWDLVSFKQTVRVKPKTKYLFSGWAKFEDVRIGEDGKNGKMGVNLGVEGSWERSSAMLWGSKDWTYITVILDSGDRTTLDVAAKLGHWTSGCFGKAWFDDMCLIELPELESTGK